MIADVRGYTKYTQEQGDEAAAALASTFADLVREVVEAHQGFLLELRGDEALVVFVSARNALRAAVEIQNRLRAEGLPRGVGIGLDAGEAIPVGEGYRGSALNLAARLCSHAAAGEVLASETVIHLAAKIDGISYIDPRMLKLKGYPEPVRAIEVTPDDRVRRAFARRATRMRRRIKRATAHKLRIGIVAIVVLLTAAGLPLALRAGGSALAKLPAGIALLDAKSAKEIAFIPQSVVRSPANVIYSDGEFWVLNSDPVSFVGIDPKTGKILQQIASPIHNVGGYTVDNDTLWVTGDSPYLWRVDVRSGQETGRFGLGVNGADSEGGDSVVVAAGSAWVPHRGDGQVELIRLDPQTGKVLYRARGFADAGAPGSWSVAFADGSLWSAAESGFNRIDPLSYVVTRGKLAGIPEAAIAAGGGFGWTADPTKGVVYKIGENGDVVATYQTGEGAGFVSYSAGSLWVANTDAGTVTAIDAITGVQRTLRFEHPVPSVAAGSGAVLVELNAGRTYEDRINALKGKVAKFIVRPYQFNPYDPVFAGNSPLARQVEFATCATLVNYPDAPAPEGSRLKPEVAASMPAVSDNGRTYTFTVRPGYRFSPPSNQPVTAETFRYSIERALSPKMDRSEPSPGPLYIPDIEGEDAFRAGKAEHVSGLVASGDQLRITLRSPSPDFLSRLALPNFCPVTTDSAVIPEGELRTVASSSDAPGEVTIPSPGPYYVADFVRGEYTILKRNPNYSGPRSHTLDAIALREGIDPGLAVARVEKQAWDGVTKLDDPVILSPYGPLAAQWGPGSAAAAKGDQRYYAAALPAVDYLAFNAGRPLFSNVLLRRAAAYAIDRMALAQPFDEVPAAQLLPPDMAGFAEHDSYSLASSDLGHARALAKGRGGHALMVINTDCDPCRQFGQAVRAALAPIGIVVRVREVSDPFAEAQDPKTEADIFNASYGSGGLSDPASYLTMLFDSQVPAGWLPMSVRSAIAKLSLLTGLEREKAAGNLQASLATSTVPLAAFGSPVIGEFFSPRLGCRIYPPFGFGVDLATLCLN